ncbi:MAG: hypothetical protein KDA25_05750 [Phycisphaerales bacterium]|nr:hypothetical protein [Phycisphaerales bacterium]
MNTPDAIPPVRAACPQRPTWSTVLAARADVLAASNEIERLRDRVDGLERMREALNDRPPPSPAPVTSTAGMKTTGIGWPGFLDVPPTDDAPPPPPRDRIVMKHTQMSQLGSFLDLFA